MAVLLVLLKILLILFIAPLYLVLVARHFCKRMLLVKMQEPVIQEPVV